MCVCVILFLVKYMQAANPYLDCIYGNLKLVAAFMHLSYVER